MIKFYRIGAVVLFTLVLLILLMPPSWFGTLTDKYIIASLGLIIKWLFTGFADILEEIKNIKS